MREPTTVRWAGVLALLLACNGGSDGDRVSTVGIASAETGGSGPGADGDGDGDGDGDDGDGDDGDGDGSGGADGGQVRFDVGDGEFCQGKDAGVYCEDNVAVTCDGTGTATNSDACIPGVCLDEVGCVDCEDGQWTCKGARVMACNTDGVPYWEQIDVCDPSAGEYCDVTVGGCSPLTPLGGTTPTGTYYQYSVNPLAADGFSTVCDVDADGDRIWFVAYTGGGQLTIGAYDVTILDSDGDGEIEPNQHPDDPENTGPIEERVFTFVQSFPISNSGAVPHTMELHATSTTIYFAGPSQVSAYDIATGTVSSEAAAPPWLAGQPYPYLAFLGYDELTGAWYSGNESARRVFQYDPETSTWGYAFEYPLLAGDHMDGMEVVTDESTGTAYVYVSDMTSNFIGQYRHDPLLGWVQENLFTYAEANGEVVEGFGYGALRHFWVGSWTQNSFYEIGGGDLTQYLEPPG
jgi:hypothetical protein